MTQLTLTINHYLQAPLEVLLRSIKSSFRSLFQSVIKAREEQAYYVIARQLKREYPGESEGHIVSLLKEGRYEEFSK